METLEGYSMVQNEFDEDFFDDGSYTDEALPEERPFTNHPLIHLSNISMNWTQEEQSLLEDLLPKYVSMPAIDRYANIASTMKNKSIRDVAFRCKWMEEKVRAKRSKKKSKKDKSSSTEKGKQLLIADSVEKSPSHSKMHPNGLPYAQLVTETDDIPTIAIGGGVIGDILDQNTQLLDQISKNFSTLQILENVDLFCKVRDNIRTLNNSIWMPATMPPLYEKMNEEDLAKISMIRDHWSAFM